MAYLFDTNIFIRSKNEMPMDNSKKRVMIPDACNAQGVRYCNLNTVLKEMGIKI